jgi:hypothetical protein
MSNIWDDEPFRDGAPVMQNGKWQEQDTYTPAPDNVIRANQMREAAALMTQKSDQDEEYDVDELTEQVSQDDDGDDFQEVMSDARLRIEQGKLYEMIMNHDLFSDVDADPRAAKAVQKQIRNFARESLEVMLGMRSTVPAHGAGSEMRNASPFNDLEVDVLKKLASAASKGATEQVEEDEPDRAPAAPPKKKTLNSIGPKNPGQRINTKPVDRPSPSKPIQKKVEPIQRTTKPPQPDKKGGILDGKSLDEMNAQEKANHLAEVVARNAARGQVIPPDRAPMPDFATQEMLALSQSSRAMSSTGKGNLSALIVANLKNSGKL